MKKRLTSPRILRPFLTTFLPLSALLGGILGIIYFSEAKTQRTILETNEARKVELQAKVITSSFDSVVSDLMIISSINDLQALLKDDTVNNRQVLAKEYLIVSQQKRFYDQIRFLDETGKEIVRVNLNGGKPRIVPEPELQSQRSRYYFKDTLKLKQREVFVSPFDLNIERGKIEQPLKPMIRFGTPIFDINGRERGILIINYLGANLLSKMKQSNTIESDLMLLNKSGFWLKSPNSEDEWGFMYPERQNKTFGNLFPEAWQRITSKEYGQFQNRDGMFTFATVYPLLESQRLSSGESGENFQSSSQQLEAKSYYWKIVSRISPEILQARSHIFLSQLLLLYAGLMLPLGIASWLTAHNKVSRLQAETELKQSQARLLELAQSEDLLKGRLASQIRNSLDLDIILIHGAVVGLQAQVNITLRLMRSRNRLLRRGFTIASLAFHTKRWRGGGCDLP